MHPTPQRRPAAHAFLADDQKIELTTALELQQQTQVVSTLPPPVSSTSSRSPDC